MDIEIKLHFFSQPETDVMTFIIIFIFPSILNNQGFVIAKSNQSDDGSISKRRLFLTLDLFALQCEINLAKKDH